MAATDVITIATGTIEYDRATAMSLVADEDIVAGDEVIRDPVTMRARRRRPGDDRFGLALHPARLGGAVTVAREWSMPVDRWHPYATGDAVGDMPG